MKAATPATLPVVRTVSDLREKVSAWRAQGKKIGMVPSMGALHDGHLSLVREALKHTDRVLATIFVNPMQFGPTEDLDRYPRQEQADIALLSQAGAHLLFAPSVEVMYPPGFSTTIHVDGVSQGLCGASRPVMFDGVATVTAKLFNQCQADLAFFGEKDFQQVQVVKRLVRDLDIPTTIVPVPTRREDDGLAMSSRNVYLSPEERKIAASIYRVLNEIADSIHKGRPVPQALEQGKSDLLQAGFNSIDYLELRDSDTLEPLVTATKRPMRLLVAAFLGKTRLIDNIGL